LSCWGFSSEHTATADLNHFEQKYKCQIRIFADEPNLCDIFTGEFFRVGWVFGRVRRRSQQLNRMQQSQNING
jgi:hypothetical protein